MPLVPVVAARLQEQLATEVVSDDTVEIAPELSRSEMTDAAKPCTNCGEPLEPDAAFCISCGVHTADTDTDTDTDAVVVAETPDSSNKRRSTKAILLGVLAIIVILAVAAGAWFLFVREDAEDTTEPADALETQQASPNTTAAPDVPATDTTTTVDTASACTEIAAAATRTVSTFAEGFKGSSIQDLVLNARIGRDLLPGIIDFNESIAALASQADTQGCEESSLQAEYSNALSGESVSSDPIAALVQSAFNGSQFGRLDPVDTISATLLLYPQHGLVAIQATAPPVEPPKWVVMLASMNASDVSSADAAARAEGFTASGIPADYLLTDPYASLNPGYWAVFAGPFMDQDAAKNYCLSIRDQVADCYQRYVQTLPTTDPPYGQCGPYGMIDVKGVTASGTLVLTAWPEDGRGNVGTLTGTATGILVAGPQVAADGQWTPVAYGSKIGWMRSELTADNPTCPRTTPAVATRTCIEIANTTLDVFKAIAAEAAAIESTGDLSLAATRSATNDEAIVGLVRDAGVGGCSAVELNALLATGRAGIPFEGTLAPLVVRALYAGPFFVDG